MKIVGYVPRESQKGVHTSQARFLTVDAGRRWGKTITGLNWLLEGICQDGGVNWWVAPVYSQSRMAFRKLISAAKKGNGDMAFKKPPSHSELRIEFKNDSVIEFKSADKPDTLRGEGLKRVVIDEAARVKKEVFEEVIRPAISDTRGRVLLLSTPKGKNWFFDMWTRGNDNLQPDYMSWKKPTADNPKVPFDDIEQARQSLPIDVFNQEYLAEFLEDSAGVFRNVKACMVSERQEPKPGMAYSAGLDLARLTDFTVLDILDQNGQQVFMDRFNLLDWAVQKQRIIATCQKYNNADLLLDSTGIGDPIYDDLRRMGLRVSGYKFTNESKKKLIECLMLSFEQVKIGIIDDSVQLNELGIFEYKINQSGTVSYSAPEGYHDDCVIGLALANWKLQNKADFGFGVI